LTSDGQSPINTARKRNIQIKRKIIKLRKQKKTKRKEEIVRFKKREKKLYKMRIALFIFCLLAISVAIEAKKRHKSESKKQDSPQAAEKFRKYLNERKSRNRAADLENSLSEEERSGYII
jgi:hypothetical protein